jgi:hypothetical protein
MMAARSCAIPAPSREEVTSTSGKAAGRVLSASSTAAMRALSSACFTWSALVSTI